MYVSPPSSCNERAYRLFAVEMPRLGSSRGLRDAAVAISLHEEPHGDPADVARTLEGYTESIRERVRSCRPAAILAHAHAVLFEEASFRGDGEHYGHPHNSYLPRVLARRRGLPITLSLVYKCVVEPLGVRVDGVNAPGHFLARVDEGGAEPPFYVDPFFGGEALSEAEAADRVAAASSAGDRGDPIALPIASHRAWLARMLRNLHHAFHAAGRRTDVAAMHELHQLLPPA